MPFALATAHRREAENETNRERSSRAKHASIRPTHDEAAGTRRNIRALRAPPSSEDKLTIFTEAVTRFRDAGYVYVGLDHFALPDDAPREGRYQLLVEPGGDVDTVYVLDFPPFKDDRR